MLKIAVTTSGDNLAAPMDSRFGRAARILIYNIDAKGFLSDSGWKVQYIDCDVEEPNGHFFISPHLSQKKPTCVMLPVVDQLKCTSCGECTGKCQFNAIVRLPGNTLIFPELCHGCGLCLLVCPTKAISEDEREIGVVASGMGWGGMGSSLSMEFSMLVNRFPIH